MIARIAAVVWSLVLVVSLVIASYLLGARSAGQTGGAPEELRPVVQLYERVRGGAVDPPDDDELVRGAVEGMLGVLDDPYAAFYDDEEFAGLNEVLEGEISGVGVLIEETPDGIEVLGVLDGTPAQEEGIESGERIVGVDGRDVRGLPIDAVANLVKGEAGTDVTLGLEGGSHGARELTLTRAVIHVPNVESELLDGSVGHVRLIQFARGAARDTRTAVEDLLDQGATGIVLDLRDNPGGLLEEAVDVAGLFIEDGTVVSVQGRGGRVEDIEATGEAFADLPLVLLVNEWSASASEIVAGAIQDFDRAPVLGVTTFGKGTVQTVHDLAGGAGAKFTTAEYLTPSGDSIEGVGVVPDKTIEDPEEQLAVARQELQALVAAAPG
ncbi:MAG TPA: S41 family peptidase [Egibacteraceae bacterium]|nr:S41 family peptidase [Egibacteraceae bacterium]